MKATEKKQLIAKVIEKLVLNGYDITLFIGKPLSYFDYEKVKKLLEEINFIKSKKMENKFEQMASVEQSEHQLKLFRSKQQLKKKVNKK